MLSGGEERVSEQLSIIEIAQRLQHAIFADGLEEFDDAREIVEGLAEEYEACESPDYIKWASGKENERMPGDPGRTGGGSRGY